MNALALAQRFCHQCLKGYDECVECPVYHAMNGEQKK